LYIKINKSYKIYLIDDLLITNDE